MIIEILETLKYIWHGPIFFLEDIIELGGNFEPCETLYKSKRLIKMRGKLLVGGDFEFGRKVNAVVVFTPSKRYVSKIEGEDDLKATNKYYDSKIPTMPGLRKCINQRSLYAIVSILSTIVIFASFYKAIKLGNIIVKYTVPFPVTILFILFVLLIIGLAEVQAAAHVKKHKELAQEFIEEFKLSN